MLLPALVERELEGVARDHHREHPEGPAPARIVDWMGALIPRVMFPASLAAAARADLGDALTKTTGTGVRPAGKLADGDARLTW